MNPWDAKATWGDRRAVRRRWGGVGLAALACLLCAGPAPASNDRHWWLGVSGGRGEVEVVGHDRSELVGQALETAGWEVLSAAGGQDDATRVLNARVGYGLMRYLGFELAYWDLGGTEGNFRALVEDDGQVTHLSGTLSSDYRTWALAALGRWPVLGWLSLNARLGGHRWEHSAAMRGAGVDENLNEAGFGALWALGVEIRATRWLGFDFSWQRFYGIEGEDGIDVQALGVVFHF